MKTLRAAFITIFFAVVWGAAVATADSSDARALELQAARRAALQEQLTSFEAQQAEADRKLLEVMRTGSATAIDEQSREIARLNDRVRSTREELTNIDREIKTLRSGAGSGLTASAPSFSATPSRTPASAPSPAAAASTPSFKRDTAAGLTPPTITKLDEATEILTRYEDYRSQESGLGRRSRSTASVTTTTSFDTATTTGTTTVPAPGPVRMSADGGDIASLGMRREMGRLLDQQQDIGREMDEIRQQLIYKQRQQAALARMDQQDQASALQREIDALNQRYVAAQAEGVRLQQNSQRLAQDVTVAGDQNVGRTASESGLQQLTRAGGPAPGSGMPDDGRFRAGDELQVIVIEDPEFNGTFKLVGSGVILPRLGRVPIIGMTAPEAELAIRQILEANFLRQASVTVERIPAPVTMMPTVVTPQGPMPERFQIIYLAGEFITPGPLRIPESVVPTLLQTIIRSGGITPSGDLTRVKLLRIVEGQGAVEEINVAGILSGEISPSDLLLQDGDIIVIPPFAPVVYVTGNVERPGTLRLFQDETLTAYAAILRAGGFARFANIRKVYVVRDLGNGEKAHIPVNIKDVQRGEAPDVILQGKDIVVVPERFFSF